jgi:hypothetical protein
MPHSYGASFSGVGFSGPSSAESPIMVAAKADAEHRHDDDAKPSVKCHGSPDLPVRTLLVKTFPNLFML